MAIILYNRAGFLPAGRLRAMLADAIPTRRWICGEEDDGSPDQTLPLRGHHLICGRGDGAPLFVELRCIDMPYIGDSAPPHAGHITLSDPTTDDGTEADQVTALIAQALMAHDAGGTWCRLSDKGGWLAAAAMEEILRRISAGAPLAHADADPHRPSRAAPRATPPAFHSELPRIDRLPTLLALATVGPGFPPAHRGWQQLAQAIARHDPLNDWRIDPRDEGNALLSGRPGRIGIAWHNSPMPAEWLQLALGREPWSGESIESVALRAHAACLAVTCDVDTAQAGPEDTRQLGAAMALALTLLAQDLKQSGRLAGLGTPAHALLFAPDHLTAFSRALEADELPTPLFVATAFHATAPGAVSLSTTGLMPFAGHEVEAWNAPGDADSIGERLGSVLRHLLTQGPVLRHGDTLGNSGIRVLHNASRAERAYAKGRSVPALWLEFGSARPYPLRPMAGVVAAPLRRPGGFGRKGL